MVNIKTILENVIENGASDLHINVGMPPILRRNTELTELDFPAVSNEDAKEMVLSMIGPERYKKFEEYKDLDFSTNLDDGHRFRVNSHYQRDTIAISFRVIPNQIPVIDDLHLPPIAKELADLPRGLVLVTGHTGSGKSTTLAAMIDLINTKYRKRIVTLEDPIEYMIENKNSMVEQREIGSDCTEFASGLKHVLRQDPDIIMVGEMRDLETTGSTVTAAEDQDHPGDDVEGGEQARLGVGAVHAPPPFWSSLGGLAASLKASLTACSTAYFCSSSAAFFSAAIFSSISFWALARVSSRTARCSSSARAARRLVKT